MLDTLTTENGINFHGRINYDEVTKIMHESDVLVHTESMDKINRNKVRYSVSTKIADSLGSGINMFAYGPSTVASMRHLIDNDCAIVCTKQEDLKEKLLTLFTENGIAVAKECHTQEKNSRMVYQLMDRIDN